MALTEEKMDLRVARMEYHTVRNSERWERWAMRYPSHPENLPEYFFQVLLKGVKLAIMVAVLTFAIHVLVKPFGYILHLFFYTIMPFLAPILSYFFSIMSIVWDVLGNIIDATFPAIKVAIEAVASIGSAAKSVGDFFAHGKSHYSPPDIDLPDHLNLLKYNVFKRLAKDVMRFKHIREICTQPDTLIGVAEYQFRFLTQGNICLATAFLRPVTGAWLSHLLYGDDFADTVANPRYCSGFDLEDDLMCTAADGAQAAELVLVIGVIAAGVQFARVLLGLLIQIGHRLMALWWDLVAGIEHVAQASRERRREHYLSSEGRLHPHVIAYPRSRARLHLLAP
jgi:hypothetical protein